MEPSHWDWLPPEIQEDILVWAFWAERQEHRNKMRETFWQIKFPARPAERAGYFKAKQLQWDDWLRCVFCHGNKDAHQWCAKWHDAHGNWRQMYHIHTRCREVFIESRTSKSS